MWLKFCNFIFSNSVIKIVFYKNHKLHVLLFHCDRGKYVEIMSYKQSFLKYQTRVRCCELSITISESESVYLLNIHKRSL